MTKVKITPEAKELYRKICELQEQISDIEKELEKISDIEKELEEMLGVDCIYKVKGLSD